jgi:hypothetical protein
MKRTLGFLSVAALLATGGVAMAAGPGSAETGAGAGNSSQSVTGTRLHSPQEGTPATGSATSMPSQTYQRNGTGMSAQSTGQYPGAVGRVLRAVGLQDAPTGRSRMLFQHRL